MPRSQFQIRNELSTLISNLEPVLSIHLNKLLFHCFHGVHEEEKILGGEYKVNVTVKYLPERDVISSLHETVNYVSLYEVVKKRMQQPTPLLETIAMEITGQFLAQFSMIQEVEISITKLHPPIVSFQGSVGVTFYKKRNQ